MTINKYSNTITARAHPFVRWAKSWPQQFIPFSRQQRDTDTCIITNAIPKSGTYFMNKIVGYLGKWENIGVHIIPGEWYTVPVHGDFIYSKCSEPFSVKKLRNGQFIAAHLPWRETIEQVIENATSARRIKHVFLYRDPRDTFVSYMRFVTNSPNYFRTADARAKQKFMRENFSNDDDRLSFIMKERKQHYSAKYDYVEYEPWLRSRNCCAVSFEDLYTEFIDIKENGFGKVLRKLFNYLEVDIDTIDPVGFYNNVYGKSLTASDEKNKIGQYQRYFKACHYRMIDNSGFRKILDAFGYEW